MLISHELTVWLSRRRQNDETKVRFTPPAGSSSEELVEALTSQGLNHQVCPYSGSVTCNLSKRQLLGLQIRSNVVADIPARLAIPRSGRASASLSSAGLVVLPQLTEIGAPDLWALGLTGEGIIVAIVDTGVDYTHPALSGRMWDGGQAFLRHGRSFVGSNPGDPMDPESIIEPFRFHGTKCAGLVAGSRTGVAPGARIMALRINQDDGSSDDSIGEEAVRFALAHGAHIISFSQSTPNPDRTHQHLQASRNFHDSLPDHCLMFASAGNHGDRSAGEIPENVGSPGCCPPPWLHPDQPHPGGTGSVITVGASEVLAELQVREDTSRGPFDWGWSTFADYRAISGQPSGLIKPDLCAPGTLVRTITGTPRANGAGASPNTLNDFRATSAATPQVAGCAALLCQASLRAGQPIRRERIQEALEMTAVKMKGQTMQDGRTVKINGTGAGRVNVKAAFEYGRERGWWSS